MPATPADPGSDRRRALRAALALLILGLFGAAAAAVGAWFVFVRDPVGDAARAGPEPARPEVRRVDGVFRGTSLADAREYATWFGSGGSGRIGLVVDFPARDTWAQIADPQYMLDEWRDSGFRTVYSIALLPERDASATLGAGAAGEYDRYYRELAENLVRAGQATSILRLGWEFNLEESRWSGDDPRVFVAYWRRIVAAMRSVPGAAFEFDWNPNNGRNRYDAVPYYPGDDVVDYIGVDAYDASWARGTYPYPKTCDARCRLGRQRNAWHRSVLGGRRGLEFWSAFARHRGKPMSLPEWGLWSRPDGHGGGENDYYLRQMHAFVSDPRNGVAYQSYFEFDGPDGPHRLMTTFTASGNTFRALFGAG